MARETKQEKINALNQWRSFYKSFVKSRTIDYSETPDQQHERVTKLLSNPIEFGYFYFPGITKSEFAKWHKQYLNHVIKHDVCHAALKVHRDGAKSSVTAILILFLYYNGKIKSLGYFSHIQAQAEMLLSAIKIAFEKNEMLRHDFGNRVSKGYWTASRFITNDGVSFRAVGAGQNPRGEKNEDSDRFDIMIFDDFDDPEVCRNPERLDQHWQYVLGDCFGALHVSGARRIIALNNKIAPDCIIERLYLHFKRQPNNFLKQINLTTGTATAPGDSNWPEAYTTEQCHQMIELVGAEAETEYFNDPSIKGTTFKKEWFIFKKMPPLSKYKILLAYLDGGFKKTRTSDTKALVLIGAHEDEFHIRKVYVDNVSVEQMIAWHYDLFEYLKQKSATAMWYMEEVFLLSLLHDHFDAATKSYGFRIPMIGDKRKKPDKDLRIANTAGFFERSKVYFDESLKEDRYTQRLIEQYLKFRIGVRNNEKDGPDAVEGGFNLINDMRSMMASDINLIPRRKSKYKI